MILPTKGITAEKALLALGGRALVLLDEPKTVSRLWEEMKRQSVRESSAITFDWFVLSLDLLFAIGAVEANKGRLVLTAKRSE